MTIPPIGHPIPGASAYVLDADLASVPAGGNGELYLGGAGVSRGYLGNPAQTAAVFLPDPFSAAPGARMYRTGDLVRTLPDGALVFLGRIDDQVHIRGYRIEPREIEAVLRRHPAVRDSVVHTCQARSGSRQLAAYVESPGSAVTPGELREHLLGQLPEWMLPAFIVVLDELPRHINGKTDRARLPAAGFTAPEVAGPRSPAEKLILDIWRDVLGLPGIGIHDDFFASSGDSLLAARIMTQVQRAFQLDVPWHALYEHRTVAELASTVTLAPAGHGRASHGAARGTAGRLTVPADSAQPPQLSFAQQRLWFLDQLAPGMLAYNIFYSYRLTGPLDSAALDRALRDVCVRHEALRWRIESVSDEPQVIVTDPAAISLEITDLRDGPGPVARARQLVAAQAGRPFDLAAGPLLRLLLLRTGRDDHVLQLLVHHIVFDGMSADIFLRELSRAYAAQLDGRVADWPPLPVSFADAAAWQRDRLSGGLLADQIAYWRERLAGAPPLLELPADRSRPATPTYQGAMYRFEIPADLARRMRAIARHSGVTFFTVMLAAYQCLIARHSGADDVVVGIPEAGRPAPELDGVVGFFVNSLPLRVTASPELTFSELIKHVSAAMTSALDHQDLPFAQLVAALAPDRDISRNPVFQVWFDLSRPRADLRLAGLGVDEFETDFVTASFDLRLDLMETGFGPLAGQLVYATDLFDADTVAAFARRYLALLRAVAEQPGVRLADLDILTAGERAQVLTGWAGPVAAPRSSQTLARRFEDQAARRPDAAAVSFGPQHVSYRELNERANRLAALLRERGVGDEVVVGLLLPRGITLAVAVLAVIKAGGAYLPLSVDFPPERISLMITDSGAAITLTESAHAERLARGMPAVVLDACQADLDRFPAGNQDGCTGIDNLLYVMYTSGSTGVPKGVAMPQRPLLNLMDWHLRRYAGGPVLQFSTTTFDMSFQEMFLPWLTGGALVPVTDDERLDPEALLAIMRRAEVGTLICPPVLLHHIASHVESAAAEVALPPLREIVAAGEELRLTPAILALVTRLQPVTLDNQYGPTETHCSASLRLSGDPATWPPVVPLGQPLTGKQLLLLDDQLRPVPAGVPGELYIGGDALARGYFGKPDLTAERFLPHPYPGSPGERLYRTGDRARWRPGGVLEFLGRADDQIKIRGCRVEPGEVEALLRRSAAVAAAAVLPVTVSGQTELAAYLVLTAELADDARRAAIRQLRARLKETLPDYLVPGYFVTLSELPLTSVGKLDRTALPSPLAGESGHGEFVAPRNPQEAVIVAIWSEALGRPSVSATADFFELGGHSLLATKVRSRIRSAFGVDLPLRALFDHRTVPALALAVEDAMAADIAAMSSAEVAAAIRDGGP